MDRFHTFILKFMERIKANRDSVQADLKTRSDKHTYGKVQITQALPHPPPEAGLAALHVDLIPRGIHKFHNQKAELESIRRFIGHTHWTPEVESGMSGTKIEVYSGCCCHVGGHKPCSIAWSRPARKPLLD